MKTFQYIIGIAFLVLWSYVGFVLFYPYKPLIIHSDLKIMNENKQVQPNQFVIYEINYTKNSLKTERVIRQLINEFIIVIPSYESCLKVGIHKIKRKMNIPAFAPPGKYKIHIIYALKVSDFPIRNISVSAWSEEFEVIKGDNG